MAASQWLHAPSVEYLVPLIVATVAAVVATMFVTRGQRWWALANVAALVLAAVVGALAVLGRLGGRRSA